MVTSNTGLYIYIQDKAVTKRNPERSQIWKEEMAKMLTAILAWNKIACKQAVDRHKFLPELCDMQ